ncbi:MAG TPA: LLM class flavin-dependent oxidoreductase [Dehalococcoidia bacterium]|nr:LLM class flavin-dependent oxidoreductase [Dehalococcoidia bacterium]
MEIGIGIDGSLALTLDEERSLVEEAVTLGYAAAWTPSGAGSRDGFHVCGRWSLWTGGAGQCLPTGIAVVPAPLWSAAPLASQAATVGELSGGRFVLGIGTGSLYSSAYRPMFGLPDVGAVGAMRDYLTALRGLLNGEAVTIDSPLIRLRRAQILQRPVSVPLYLAALGPQMLRLAGRLADGVSLNWCTPEQRAWCREQVAAGASAAGRDPAAVRITEYIRVCVDEDEDRARRGLARAVMGYALSRPGAGNDRGYRAHFGRMGFETHLQAIEAKRDSGASEAELIDAFPPELLRAVGYYGPAAGAAAAFARPAEGLDLAIVRIVPARPGLEGARAALRACRPDLVGAPATAS